MDTMQMPAALSGLPSLAQPPVQVVARPSIFRDNSVRRHFTVPHGATLLDILVEAGMGEWRDGRVHLPGNVAITINGDPVERRHWHRCRPRADRIVNIFLLPGNQRQAILIGAAIVIAVASVYTFGAVGALAGGGLYGTLAGGLAGAAIAVGGNYALTAFLPVEADNVAITDSRGATAVTGQSNRLERNAFVPVVMGSIRIYPYHYAMPYTERGGSDLYLRMILVVCQGPAKITGLKVGDTDIDDLGSDIEYEIREGRATDDPLTLFTRDIFEVNPSATIGEIRHDDGPYIQTTQDDTTEITVDLTWPNGIYRNLTSGKRDPYHVEFTIEISPTGSPSVWTDFVSGSVDITRHEEEHETSNLIRKSFRRKNLTAGQYDVRVTRRSGDNETGDNNIGQFFWTALRSIQPGDPRPDKTLACIALRVKRTPTGNVEAINCLAQSYALDWNGAAWVEATTNNPASLGRHLLQGAGVNPNPIADARMDLPSWEDFHDHCADEGFAFNGVFEDESTIRERLSAVLTAGRGRLIPPDTKYAVAIDRNGKTHSGMITPRNSSNFRGIHILRDELQALRVLFLNEDKNFTLDERLVFADGFDDLTIDDGKVEIFDLSKSGITDPDLAWRHARYRLADHALRLDIYQVTQGFESLQHTVGDLVAFQYDTALLGLGRGRIKSVTVEGSPAQVTEVTIDDAVTMEAGKTYEARVRLIDDSGVDQFIARAVTTVAGETKTLAFSTPFDADAAPKIGDLLAFGETSLATINCIIKDIIPGNDNSAEVVLIDEAPGVNTADEGPIPEYTSQITLPGDFFGTPPAVPVIERIVVENISLPTQPDVITQQKLVVHLQPLGSAHQAPTGYEVEIKRADQAVYQRRHPFPADATELTIDSVHSNYLYDVRVRATGRSPRGIPNASAWSTVEQIFVPLPERTLGTTARVTGLELFGQASNTEFVGPDAHFVWRLTAIHGAASIEGDNNALSAFVDPAFSFYEVQVIDPATSHVRRIERLPTQEFVYTFSKNKEDSLRQAAAIGGSTRPLRDFALVVTFVDKFSQRGPGQSLTVSNPAPATPSGLIVSGQVSALFVKADLPDDADFEKIKVYISSTPGFDPDAAGTDVQEAQTNFLTIPQPAGTNIFVRVAMADRFSDQHTDLNLSSELAVAIEAPDGPPQFTLSEVTFKARKSTDTVMWTSGTMFITEGASVLQETVAAGQATWTTGVLWLYYVRGSGVIQATTNAALAQQPDRHVVAQYFGANRLTLTGGIAPVSNLVTTGETGQLGSGIDTYRTVLELPAITTIGNAVKLEAMLEGSASGAGEDASIQIQFRFRRGGNVLATFDMASDSVTGAGAIGAQTRARYLSIRDTPAAGTYVYDIQARADFSGTDVHDQDADWFGYVMSAEEALL